MPGFASVPMVTNPVTIFLVVMGIILIVPLLLQRLKIPYVIGLILAGVAVGPYGLHVLDRDMSFEVFGQVGLLYLMFLAGLEIDMYHLKKNLRRGLTFGALTFFIPLILGIAAGTMILGLNMAASLLLASMFAAHTLLAYPIVSRFGLTRTPAVVIAIAGTIVTVLGALIVLAGVGGIVREGTFSPMQLVMLLGIIATFCLLTVYLYPRVTRWFFKRYSDTISQFIYVLAMVFLAASVARWIGIESVFGAFFGGLVLNRYIPGRSPLMGRLEFVGNAIFIPYFLIGVGMLINLHVLTRGWDTLYIAGIMSAVALGSKWLAAFATQRVYKLRSHDRSMLYQLSNAHTAVALAVVTIGFNMHLLSEEILNGTIVMILVTCTVSSLGTERAAMKIKLHILENDDDDAAGKEKPGAKLAQRTLITVSNPITAPSLVELALLMRGGRSSSPESPLYALYVRGSDHSNQSRAMGVRSLDEASKAAAAVDATLIPIERYDLNVVTGVLNTALERDANEIIFGLHRRSTIADTFFGAKMEQLLRATNRMLIISRCFIPVNTLTRIVVSVPQKAQFETGFRRWVESLASLARELGCRIIFHCHPDTKAFIRTAIHRGGYGVRAEFISAEGWDDFVLMANTVLDDDLLVIVSARRASVSFDSDMDMMPDFLQRYFSRNNLLVIFPEQFGDELVTETSAAAMSADFVATPSPLWLKLRHIYRRAIIMRKRFTQRNRQPRIP